MTKSSKGRNDPTTGAVGFGTYFEVTSLLRLNSLEGLLLPLFIVSFPFFA